MDMKKIPKTCGLQLGLIAATLGSKRYVFGYGIRWEKRVERLLTVKVS